MQWTTVLLRNFSSTSTENVKNMFRFCNTIYCNEFKLNKYLYMFRTGATAANSIEYVIN
jgi:hypothetical protein